MATNREVIGLTGGIGAGKSTAAGILAELGAVVVDCDQLGREVVAADGGAAYAPIVERFGPAVVGADGELDRPALGRIVFGDAEALADLNAITHPAIDDEIAAAISAADPDDRIVLDMAVLVESDLGTGLYDRVVVIEAPIEQRLERLAETRGMARADAMARVHSQATDAERRAVADDVIVNDGDVDALRVSLASWWAGRI